MRNPLRLLRLPGRRRARRVSARPALAAPRRYEHSRAEARRTPRHVSWRRLGATVLLAAGAGGVLYGAAWLLTGDSFRVRVVQVNGAQVVDVQAVVNAAGVAGASLFTLHSAEATQAIAQLPAVKAVHVSRVWPHGVRIDIVEHQAWGYWQVGGQRLVIDADGRVLEQSRPPAADAPTILELGAPRDRQGGPVTDPDTVQLVERLRSDGTFERLQVRPTGFLFSRDRGLTVLVANGPAAVLGDSSNYDFKVGTWQVLLAEARQHPAPPAPGAAAAGAPAAARAAAPAGPAAAAEIDLRFGRNVVLR